MGTTYPARIDTSQSLPTVVDNLTPVRGVFVNQLRDAIIAIEATLGIQPNGIYSSVGARITNLENTVQNLQPITLAGDLGGTLTSQIVIGIQGRPIASNAPIAGQVLTWNGLAWAPGTGIVEEYTITVAARTTLAEISQSIVDPIFDATYSQVPVTAVVVDNVGSPPENVFAAPPPSTPPDVFVYPQSYQFDTYPATPSSVTWTLTSSDGITTRTATTTTTWVQRLYFGAANPSALISSLSNGVSLPQATINVDNTADAPTSGTIYVLSSNGFQTVSYTGITGTSFTGCTGGAGTIITGDSVLFDPADFMQFLANTPLGDTKTMEIVVNASDYVADNAIFVSGRAIYFGYRSAYGPADFWVNGFEGGFSLVSDTIPVTNPFGFTENYTLYQSNQVSLGLTDINVF